MMIADLGLSKDLNNSTSSSASSALKFFGMPAFVEPQCFKNETYKRDKRSDIYSLGTLLWEISNGHAPFKSFSRYVIPSKILRGERELPIEGTSSEYIELYQQCWDYDPDKRPNIQKILEVLNETSSQYNTNKDLSNTAQHEINQSESALPVSISDSLLCYGKDDDISVSNNDSLLYYGEDDISNDETKAVPKHF